MKIKALSGFVIVEGLDHDEETRPSGLVMLKAKKHNVHCRGKVISAGRFIDHKTGREGNPIVKEGDIILYKKYEAEVIKLDTVWYYRIPYSRVVMTVDE